MGAGGAKQFQALTTARGKNSVTFRIPDNREKYREFFFATLMFQNRELTGNLESSIQQSVPRPRCPVKVFGMSRARQHKKPPHNVHDVHPTLFFNGLAHEHITFPHVHDVHDVHPRSLSDLNHSIAKELIPLPPERLDSPYL